MLNTQVFELNDGNTIPVLGLGTWRSKPEDVTTAVKHAIDVGYRHIDCAYINYNEKEIGQAISDKINEGVVKRENLFITSKLWNTHHQPEFVEEMLRKQLANLDLDYLDLYLMQFPYAYKEGDKDVPLDDAGNIEFSDVDFLDTWLAMEELVEKGLTKSIGVANFNIKQLQRLCTNCRIPPVNHQIECNPYFTQQKMIQFCKFKNITITAFCTLGFPKFLRPSDFPNFMNDFRIKSLARRYKKTEAQIVLRYQLQRGVIVIPETVDPVKIRENIDIFDFKINSEFMKRMGIMDRNKRVCWYPSAMHHKDYPFKYERHTIGGVHKLVDEWDFL